MSPKILPKLTGKDNPEKSSATPKPAAAHVPQNLEFVNLPSNLKLDVAARRRVRSHVARDFRRRPRAAAGSGSSSSLDVDHDVAKTIAREVAPGQKHRFRFGLQGLQETGRQSKRKSVAAAAAVGRKGAEASRDTSSAASRSPASLVVDNSNINVVDEEEVEDHGGFGMAGFSRSLEGPGIAITEEFNMGHVLDAPHDAEFMWGDYDDMVTNQTFEEENSYQYFTSSPQEMSSDESQQGKGKLVLRRANVGYVGHAPVQPQMNLASTGTGSLDPFSTLPIMDSSSRTQVLMHHFHLRIMASPLMMNPRKEWFSIAIQDQALFHVALSHAAGNLSLLTQKGDSVESLMHRMEAIRIINERLNDASSGISDGTIGAVASIASYEATNGTIEGVRTHMNGLEQMVRSRGGLHQGGFSAHLRRLIAWADLNAANALSTAPRFPPLSDRQELRIDQFAIDPIAFELYSTPLEHNQNQVTALGTMHAATTSTAATTTATTSTATGPTAGIRTPTDIQALPPKVAYCFLTIRQLSRLLAINGPKAVIRMDHTWYSDMAYTVQRRLMHLASLPPQPPPPPSTTTSSASTTTSNPNFPIPALSSCSSSSSQYDLANAALFPPLPPQQHQNITATTTTTTASLSRPCCLAALIYLECCIREIHPRSRLIGTLVSDLKAALLTLRGRASASASRLVFWALAVGAAASGADSRVSSAAAGLGDGVVGVGGTGGRSGSDDGRAEDLHAWFVTQLGSLAPVLGVRGWEEARDILGGVLWPGRESELTRALVWSEVEMADSRVDCWTVGSE